MVCTTTGRLVYSLDYLIIISMQYFEDISMLNSIHFVLFELMLSCKIFMLFLFDNLFIIC